MAGETSPATMWPIRPLVEWAGLGEPTRIARQTPWASVVCWELDEATLWGKSMCPGFAAECSIVSLLARLQPDMVVAPLRSDRQQGFLLLSDGGPTMDSNVTVEVWGDAIVRYAGLQQQLVGHEISLLEAGCVDLRPEVAVAVLTERMSTGVIDDRPHLLDWLGGVAQQMSDEIGATIQHDDLQPSNVFRDGRVFDWGDASLAHPFASLLSALMPGNPRRPGNQQQRRVVRDAYLESWATFLGLTFESERDRRWLVEQADLAMLIAPIGRIETWLRAPADALMCYPDAVDYWVRHLEQSCNDPAVNAL